MRCTRVYSGRVVGHRFVLTTFYGEVTYRSHLLPAKAEALQELFDGLKSPWLVDGLLQDGRGV